MLYRCLEAGLNARTNRSWFTLLAGRSSTSPSSVCLEASTNSLRVHTSPITQRDSLITSHQFPLCNFKFFDIASALNKHHWRITTAPLHLPSPPPPFFHYIHGCHPTLNCIRSGRWIKSTTVFSGLQTIGARMASGKLPRLYTSSIS